MENDEGQGIRLIPRIKRFNTEKPLLQKHTQHRPKKTKAQRNEYQLPKRNNPDEEFKYVYQIVMPRTESGTKARGTGLRAPRRKVQA